MKGEESADESVVGDGSRTTVEEEMEDVPVASPEDRHDSSSVVDVVVNGVSNGSGALVEEGTVDTINTEVNSDVEVVAVTADRGVWVYPMGRQHCYPKMGEIVGSI